MKNNNNNNNSNTISNNRYNVRPLNSQTCNRTRGRTP